MIPTLDFGSRKSYGPNRQQVAKKGHVTKIMQHRKQLLTTTQPYVPSEFDDEGEPRPLRICTVCAGCVPDDDPGVETENGSECSVHSDPMGFAYGR